MMLRARRPPLRPGYTLVAAKARRPPSKDSSTNGKLAGVLRNILSASRGTYSRPHYSHRGNTDASGDYQRRLTSQGVDYSMSQKSGCWDNRIAACFDNT